MTPGPGAWNDTITVSVCFDASRLELARRMALAGVVASLAKSQKAKKEITNSRQPITGGQQRE
jgi:hypothetical protein